MQKVPAQVDRDGDADPQIVAEWPLKRGEIARVSFNLCNGVWLVDIGKWIEADGQILPSSKGIKLAVRDLPRFAAVLTRIHGLAKARGLIPSEDEAAQ